MPVGDPRAIAIAGGLVTTFHGGAHMGDRTCSVDRCDRKYRARGFCGSHYGRWRAANRDQIRSNTRAANSVHWVGDDVGYQAMHRRIKKARGSAVCYDCQHCGKTAAEWAYDHRDSDARTDRSTSFLYSVDVWHYFPLCHLCHFRFDADQRHATRKLCPQGHDYAIYMTVVGKDRRHRCRKCHAAQEFARKRRPAAREGNPSP